MRAGDTIQTRGGGRENIVCVAGYLFLFLLLYVTLSGTVLEDGWLWPRNEEGKKSRFILEHGTQ